MFSTALISVSINRAKLEILGIPADTGPQAGTESLQIESSDQGLR